MEKIIPSTLVTEQEIIALTHSQDHCALSLLCTGVFDLLHKGHILYLKSAAYMALVLTEGGVPAQVIVSVACDAYTKKFKGPDRPIISENDRAEIVSRLRGINYVFINPHVISPDDIPQNAEYLYTLNPSFLVLEDNPESLNKLQAAIAAGIRIATISGAPKLESTTNIIRKIASQHRY